jgi:hypothetical protein
MSLMSAAEARQVADASPDVPSPRLQIARSARRSEDPGTGPAPAADVPQGAGIRPPARENVTQRQAALRVRRVRVVREVSIRSQRASAGQARTAGETVVTRAARAGVVGQAAVVGQARVVGQAGAHTSVAAQALVTRRTRVTRQTIPAGRAQLRPGPVRLTRRGRLVVAGFAILLVAAVVTVLVLAAAGSVQASSHASAPGSAYRGMREVVVQPGQTLWSIAAAADPSDNLWPVVQQIMNVNALSSVKVQAGQLLWVPKG